MQSDELIEALVRGLRPVAPLPLPRTRAWRWGLASIASTGLVVLAIGTRADLGSAMRSSQFVFQFSLLLMVSGISAGVALVLATPGERAAAWQRLLPYGAFTLWSGALAVDVYLAGRVDATALTLDSGWGCVAKVLAAGLVPGALLLYMIGRSSTGEARMAISLVALGVGAVGASAAALTCPIARALHILVWHAGPTVGLLTLAALVASAVLSRRSRPRRIRVSGCGVDEV
jgi:hypothetical protein